MAVLGRGRRQQLVLALQELEDGLRQLAAVARVVAGAPLEGRRPSGLGRGGSHVDGTGKMSRGLPYMTSAKFWDFSRVANDHNRDQIFGLDYPIPTDSNQLSAQSTPIVVLH